MKQRREKPRPPVFVQALRVKCVGCGYWIPEDLCRECRKAVTEGAVLQLVPGK